MGLGAASAQLRRGTTWLEIGFALREQEAPIFTGNWADGVSGQPAHDRRNNATESTCLERYFEILGLVASSTGKLLELISEEFKKHGVVSYGKVAAVAVVRNEDGAHHVSAEIFQALNDVGFTIPANAVAYWVGAAMGSTNFVDLEKTPEAVQTMISVLAHNTVHLAKLLKQSAYPGEEG
ncbi:MULTISPECIES: hypothetical protein [unclassified Rhizobium]|uniref:hypothetical protein n=1 Tax=unclassified Rhizobium TaxID=2613769 RepID=UPI00381E956B